MFSKNQRKKGFTLVEMLVVIAVIAILVSVVLPIISNSKAKAAAATNAANLRAIEGKISTMRIEHPTAFKNAVKNASDTVDDIINEVAAAIGVEKPVHGVGDALVGAVNFVLALTGHGTLEEELDKPDGTISTFANLLVYNHTADENGVIVIQLPDVSVSGCPESEAVKAGDMNIPKGLPMTVYITESTIVASYEYDGYKYVKEDFVAVADTGEFTGTGSGGVSQEGAGEKLACEIAGVHSIATGKCECKYCEEPMDHPEINKNHECTNCGATTGCSDSNKDHKCDACETPLSSCNANYYGNCDTCGKHVQCKFPTFSLGTKKCRGCNCAQGSTCTHIGKVLN